MLLLMRLEWLIKLKCIYYKMSSQKNCEKNAYGKKKIISFALEKRGLKLHNDKVWHERAGSTLKMTVS